MRSFSKLICFHQQFFIAAFGISTTPGVIETQQECGATVCACINGPLLILRPHVSDGLWLNRERWRVLCACSLSVCSVKRQRWRRELLTLCGINQLRGEFIPHLNTRPKLPLKQHFETGRHLSATHCLGISLLSFLVMFRSKVSEQLLEGWGRFI